jgi:hypothetical protein
MSKPMTGLIMIKSYHRIRGAAPSQVLLMFFSDFIMCAACSDIIYTGYLISGNRMTMHIDNYSFGRIVINNKTYSSDVIVFPDRVDPSWWRKEGHCLNKEDLSMIVMAKPDIVIIGTGQSGAMEVPKSTVVFLESHGIKVCIGKTGRAVELFNNHPKDKIVIGAFHLTC